MSSINLLAIVLGVISAVTNIHGKPADDLTHDQIFALTRDNLGRTDPDALFNGFIPVWAIIIFVIAIAFCAVGIFAGCCHILGCRNRAATVKHTVLTNY